MTHRVLAVGPPGTGKTRFGIELVKEAIDRKDIPPERILYSTFTRSGAYEARRRAIEAFPDLSESQFPYFRTLHSIAFRLLGLNTHAMFDGRRLKEFANTFKYKFSDNTLDKDLFQQDLIDMSLGTEADAYLAFDEWRKNKLMLDVDDALREFTKTRMELPRGFNPKALRLFLQRKEEYKQKEGLWEFSDLLLKVYLDKIPLDVDFVVIDEANDQTPLLQAVAELWASSAKEFYLLGDPDQCLPAGTKVACPDGEVKVEEIREGSSISVSIGSGHLGVSKVSKVHKRLSPKLFITLRTKKGKELTLTTDHRLFAHVPFTYTYRPRMSYHYVYLMQNDKYGWRIGTTNIPGARLRLEGRPIPKMFLIRDFDTLEEARYYEAFYSLRYGIPTQTFVGRGKQFIYGDTLRRLCNELGIEGRVNALASDLGIDLKYPIWIPQSTTLAHPSRVIVNVRMATYHPNLKRSKGHVYGYHCVSVETGDRVIQDKLKDCGYKLRRGGRFLDIYSKDFSVVMAEALKLSELCGGQIRITHTAIGNRGKAVAGLLMPAGNVTRGFMVPILDQGRLIFDEVVDIKREFRIEETYDLDVDQYHNYIANGILVHNCIYSFQGSDPSIMIDLKRDEDIVLKQSHRCSKAVHDLSRKVVSRMKVRYHSDFLPTPSEGLVSKVPLHNLDLDGDGTTFCLFRTRYLMDIFLEYLLSRGIPFTVRRGKHSPLDKSESEAVHTLYRLADGASITMQELHKLVKFIPQNPYLRRGAKVEIADRAKNDPNHKISMVSLPALGFASEFIYLLDTGEYVEPLKISPEEKRYYRLLLNKYGAQVLVDKPKIEVGTIHSAKGLEADRVILSLELTRLPFENLMRNPDEEMRCFYVGVTRARNEVNLLLPEHWRSFPL